MMKTNIKTTLAAVLLAFLALQAHAQLSPFGASWFQDQYLNNAALVGQHERFVVNGVFRKQLTDLPGRPVNQVLTAEYGFRNHVGAGLTFYNDKTGIFKTTKVLMSYSYAIPLAADRQLRFGISGGLENQRISMEDVSGDSDDTGLASFNRRETYIDGDFGAAYTGSRVTAQLSFPQLKDLLSKDHANLANYATFFSALSYRINTGAYSKGSEIEPKICYRGIKGSGNIVDLGANLLLGDRKVNLFGMYHSSKSCSFGLGMTYKSVYINGIYGTGNTAISNYTSGDFEISLRFGL